MLTNELSIGMNVRTVKGDRQMGPGGILKVISMNHFWRTYPGSVCEKEDGTKRLFLNKNLTLI